MSTTANMDIFQFGGHPQSVTLIFGIDNVAASATTDGGFAKGGGWPVPPGSKFYPVSNGSNTNDAATAGSATVKIIVNGTELEGGPESVIDTTNTLSHSGVVAPGVVSVDAGDIVKCSATATAGWLPITADFDVTITGYLVRDVS